MSVHTQTHASATRRAPDANDDVHGHLLDDFPLHPSRLATPLQPPLPPSPWSMDGLADLFLGGAAQVPPQTSPSIANRATRAAPQRVAEHEPAPDRLGDPGVECVLPVHAPAAASAAVQHYARARALALHAPIAQLDLRNARAWVQILDPAPNAERQQQAPAPPSAASLDDALTLAAGHCRDWLLRTDDTDLAAVLGAFPEARLVVLCAADDPSSVAAYRLVKRLLEIAPTARIRVVAIDPDAELAGRAADRVAAAARSFLTAELDVHTLAPPASTQPARTPFACDTLFAGPLGGQAAAATIAALASLLQAEAAPPRAHVAPPSPPTQPPPLATLIPGLEPLKFTCPADRDLALALGPQGRLHILLNLQHAVPAMSHPTPALCDRALADTADAMTRLRAARAWARDHAQLLQAAIPGLRDHQPALHLAVLDARASRGLLDQGVNIHVLVAFPCGNHLDWTIRPLN